MSRLRPELWLAPLFLLGLAWPRGDGKGPPGAPLPATEPEVAERVSAKEVWAHPGRYLGRSLCLEVQVHSHPVSWNPFLTRFGTTDFACVSAWAAEQLPWDERAWEHPLVRAFLRRGSAAHWALEGAERYRCFELTGTVRSVFAGVPWFEVSGVKPLLREIGEGTVLHASRGIELARDRAWTRARSEFERALVGGLPEAARVELERWIEVCDEQLAAIPRVVVPVGKDR